MNVIPMNELKNLVILHGWNHSAAVWQEAQSQLKSEVNAVYIPDLPGFGMQPQISEEATIPDYANWVKKYISQHGLDKNSKNVILMGHSFGGRISAYIASENPSWLETLILYAAPVIYRPTQITKIKYVLSKLVKALVGNNSRHVAKIKAQLNKELAEADANNLGKIFRNTVSFDQSALLPKIHVPTYILYGDKDIEVSWQIIAEAAQLIPHAQLEVIKNAGHNIHLENSTLFYGLLRNIIRTSTINQQL